MAEHEATVEITTGRRTIKISGSEAFVEKMIDALPAALSKLSPPSNQDDDADYDEPDDDKEVRSASKGLDQFVERVKLTDDMAAITKVAAFTVFLSGQSGSCTMEDIEECFDSTGLKTPTSLKDAVGNANKRSLIRSAGRGRYAPTTNGKNLVKGLKK